jgi:hypothetical protein
LLPSDSEQGVQGSLNQHLDQLSDFSAQ